MGLLKNAMKNGISDGISKGLNNAVGKAVEKAVMPKAEQWANRTADQIDQATQSMGEAAAASKTVSTAAGSADGWEGAFANLQKSAENYATEVSKNLKICSACGETTTADKKFCPHCGAKLPDNTAADGVVCRKCGHQNTIGTRFCAECGTVLPAAEAEVAAEKAEREREEAERLAEEQRIREEEARRQTAAANPLGDLKDAAKNAKGLFKKFL